MKATHCGQENRSSDPGQGVRNEIIAVMERFAASGCSFFADVSRQLVCSIFKV